MKKRVVAGTMALALLLAGCGNLAGGHNVDSGFAYIDSLQYEKAMESFDNAVENGEDECLIHRGRGIVYLKTGDYQAATEELMASLASDEGIVDDMDFDTNYYLAEAYYRLGEYNKSKEVYDAILGLHSKDSNAYYLRGVAELASGNHDSAYSDFTKAISLNAKDYAMIIMIYKALSQHGYDDEGLALLQKAMDNGSNFMTNYEKGQMSFYLKNYADAQEFLDTARNERDQEKEPVVLLLGQTWEILGEYTRAMSVYKSYISDNPDSAAVYNQLGMCQIRHEDYDGAITSFEAGLALDDDGNPELKQALMLNRITAYEYKGEFATADSYMAEYRREYPDDTAAEREEIFLSTR